ncbi:hypothetical protein BY996DRAFT_6543564 [Phakopsora pachyrhizi]|nr:hypothetical protein BY996DRAFT_6543564 [Phakopsora pachyrhizi]
MNTVSSCSKIEVGGSIAGNNGWMQNLDGWCLLLQGDVTTRCNVGRKWCASGLQRGRVDISLVVVVIVVEAGVKTSGKKMEVVVDKDEGLLR